MMSGSAYSTDGSRASRAAAAFASDSGSGVSRASSEALPAIARTDFMPTPALADSACIREADIGLASSLAEGLRSLTISRDTICSGAALLGATMPFNAACLAVILALVFAVEAGKATATLASSAPVRPSS